MFSCIMAVLAVNLTTWTLNLNMTGQTSSLYHLPTLIGTLHFLKLTTITVSKVIVDVIQFTLPLTAFLLVSTINTKASYFSIILLVLNNRKTAVSTGRTSLGDSPCCIRATFTKSVSTAHTQTRILAGTMTHLTDKSVWYCDCKLIVITTIHDNQQWHSTLSYSYSEITKIVVLPWYRNFLSHMSWKFMSRYEHMSWHEMLVMLPCQR